jgi:hypothetical protein
LGGAALAAVEIRQSEIIKVVITEDLA